LPSSQARPCYETDENRQDIQAARTSLHQDGFLAAWSRGRTADTDTALRDDISDRI
jgi:hypothetical protein